MKKKDISQGMIRQEDLANIADQIETQGGYRQNIANYDDRAETLSDVIRKMKEKGNSTTKLVDGPAKAAKSSALRMVGRKLMGAVPLLGAGYAALSGDPAMAGEELEQDLMGPAGSESAGMSPDEEKLMLAEDRAAKSYSQSPSRMGKLSAAMGSSREPAAMSEEERYTEGLASDAIPHEDAGALRAEQVTPAMEKMLQDELKGASEITPEGMRMMKIKRLFNLKG